MSLYEITKIDRKGFPQFVIEPVNQLIDLANRELRIEFDTDSLDPKVAKVIETDESITWHLPRAAAGGSVSNPYIMGTNNSAAYPDAAANDSWPASKNPDNKGVAVGAGFSAGACALARVFDSGDGKHFIFFTRGIVADSEGKITGVTVETGIPFVVTP